MDRFSSGADFQIFVQQSRREIRRSIEGVRKLKGGEKGNKRDGRRKMWNRSAENAIRGLAESAIELAPGTVLGE